MNSSLCYTGGAENYKQVLFSLLNEIEDLQDEIKDALLREFPKNKEITFEFGNGHSHGKVDGVYVKGTETQLNVVLHTGKRHYIDVRKVRRLF